MKDVQEDPTQPGKVVHEIAESRILELSVEERSAIEKMAATVESNGNLIFSACYAGQSRSLVRALHELTGKRLNIFLNQDKSDRVYLNGKLEIWTGRPLTHRAFHNGWTQINSKGEVFNLRDQPGKKGNIRLDSRVGKEPVTIE